MQHLIAGAERLEASAPAKAAHSGIRAQLDELKRQLAEEEAAVAKTLALKMDNQAILSFEEMTRRPVNTGIHDWLSFFKQIRTGKSGKK